MENKLSIEDIITSTATFRRVCMVYDKMVPLYKEIMSNKRICEILDHEIHMPQPSGKDISIDYKVVLVMSIDLIKCYQNMGHHISFENKDSYLLPIVTNLVFRQEMSTSIEFEAFMSMERVEFLYKNILRSFETWAKNDGKEFLFTRVVKSENTDICQQYVKLLLLASNYIKWATPGNIRQEYGWTAELREISF